MVAVAVACLPVFFTGHRIGRWEGGFFLTAYAGYAAYLVLTSTGRIAPVGVGPAGWTLGAAVVAVTAAAALRSRGRAGRGP